MKTPPKFPQPILRAEAWPGAVKLIGRERTVCFSTRRRSDSERSGPAAPSGHSKDTSLRQGSFKFNINSVLPVDFTL